MNKKIRIVSLVFVLLAPILFHGSLYAEVKENSSNPKVENAQSKNSTEIILKEYAGSFVALDEGEECKKASGKIVLSKECDGTVSAWCVISEKEQCYADQVKNGHCTAGQYDENTKSIVGISPRVLCDKEQ